MKISISYINLSYYDKTNILKWFWMFKRYKYVNGFIVRIFGIYLNIRENNATEKLIAKARQQ